jgi:hypothetical protein
MMSVHPRTEGVVGFGGSRRRAQSASARAWLVLPAHAATSARLTGAGASLGWSALIRFRHGPGDFLLNLQDVRGVTSRSYGSDRRWESVLVSMTWRRIRIRPPASGRFLPRSGPLETMPSPLKSPTLHPERVPPLTGLPIRPDGEEHDEATRGSFPDDLAQSPEFDPADPEPIPDQLLTVPTTSVRAGTPGPSGPAAPSKARPK